MANKRLVQPATGLTFRPDIQGLRAIAVGLVVLAHAKVAGFAGGFVGVDVFFVLSGYLITGLLAEERLATGTILYGRFLARRLRRLLPAMLVMLVSVLVVSFLLLTTYEMQMQSRSFPYAVTWLSNFFFAFAEHDYFHALQAKDLFLHTWSLGVEEQFYLVWPWLILLSFGVRYRNEAPHLMRNTVLGVLVVVFAASLALSLYLSGSMPILSFYMMPARGWQFALGAAVYVGLHLADADKSALFLSGRVKSAVWGAGVAGLALVLGSAVLLGPNITYPGYYALLPSFGAALLIGAGKLSVDSGVMRVLRSRPFVWTGDRSYSIYLWHWPVLILGDSLRISQSAPGILFLVAISLVLASISYRYIEWPFWKGQYSRAAPRTVVLTATLTIVATMGCSVAVDRLVLDKKPIATDMLAYQPRLDMPKDLYGPEKNCDSSIASAELVPCTIGDAGGDGLVVVLGDSIGAQWATMLAGIFRTPNWQVTVLTKSACAIADLDYFYHGVGADYEVCTQWRSNALRYISQIRPDIVVVGSSASYEFSETEWIDGSLSVLRELSKSTDQVVLIPGTPRLSFDGPSCLQKPGRSVSRSIESAQTCEESQGETRPAEVAGYLHQSASTFDNVAILDLADLVCPDGRCAAQSADGVIVFRDHAHLTVTFVNSLIPAVRERLAEMGVSAAPN